MPADIGQEDDGTHDDVSEAVESSVGRGGMAEPPLGQQHMSSTVSLPAHQVKKRSRNREKKCECGKRKSQCREHGGSALCPCGKPSGKWTFFPA